MAKKEDNFPFLFKSNQLPNKVVNNLINEIDNESIIPDVLKECLTRALRITFNLFSNEEKLRIVDYFHQFRQTFRSYFLFTPDGIVEVTDFLFGRSDILIDFTLTLRVNFFAQYFNLADTDKKTLVSKVASIIYIPTPKPNSGMPTLLANKLNPKDASLENFNTLVDANDWIIPLILSSCLLDLNDIKKILKVNEF